MCPISPVVDSLLWPVRRELNAVTNAKRLFRLDVNLHAAQLLWPTDKCFVASTQGDLIRLPVGRLDRRVLPSLHTEMLI